jgi:hypothetical protein
MGKALAGLYRQGQIRDLPLRSLGVSPFKVCTMIGALYLLWRFQPLELGSRDLVRDLVRDLTRDLPNHPSFAVLLPQYFL